MDETFAQIVREAVNDADLTPGDIPNIDLYMDQILTLVDDKLSCNSRQDGERPLTKTMINNYSKERLILPVKGKKYSREQVMQILCILHLKQTLALGDIKSLMRMGSGEGTSFERAYGESLRLKQKLRERMPGLIEEALGGMDGLETHEKTLAIALTLSFGANYLRRVCEGMIDAMPADIG